MSDSNFGSSDEALEALLRRVAETPSVEVARGLRVGDRLASGRIHVVEKLGKGGMGEVFAVHDDEKGRLVALKVVGRITPRAVVQVKREFRSASELLHPNIVRYHELFCDGPDWFFTMELVRGVFLPQLLARSEKEARADVVRLVVGQLADALDAVHGAGALHGDLKPSNFLVEENGGLLRTVLLDFGLTRPIGHHDGSGTLAYMAPEQILGEASSTAIDCYSLGVVLHEALTGAIPRAGVLAPSLAQAPPDLRELCVALLQRRPEDRPTATMVMRRLGIGTVNGRASVPPSARPHLVGRQEEMARLQELRAHAPGGRPSIVLVHGASGMGKTALLEGFVDIERARGAIVLKGRCRENESIGYKAVDGVVDDLVSVLSEMTDTEVRDLLPRSVGDLAQLFPALRGVPAIAEVPEEGERLDQGLVRLRAIAAFADLLRKLGGLGPVLMWIDDLQWSDSESALVLGPLLGGAEPAALFFVGSYRTDDARAVPIVSALYSDRTLNLPPANELALGPLRVDDAEELAMQSLPAGIPDAAEKAKNIGRDAGGLPLFIAELAHGWNGIAVPSGEMPAVTLEGVVMRRVLQLPEEARELLELVSVAGGPVARSVLRQARGSSAAELEDDIRVLRASRLLLTKGLRDEHDVDVRHDRLREFVSRALVEHRRRRHHLTLAIVLEANGGKPDAIAMHYQGADDSPRAGPFWLAAADDSARALAFLKAVDFYGRALDHAVLAPSERRRVEMRRAEMFAHAGEGRQAAEHYLALTRTSPREEAIELRRRAAEQLLLSGLVQEGLGVIEDVLAATRMPRSRGGRGALPSVVLGRLRLRVRGLRYTLRQESEIAREDLARLDVSWTIACSMGFVDFIRGADFQNRHLLLALQAGEPRRLARALALEALNTSAPAQSSRLRTEHLLQISSSLLAEVSDPETVLALISLVRGVTAYLQSDVEKAVVHCTEAVETLTARGGAVWERATAQRFLIAALFHAGEFARLGAMVPPLLAEAEGTANIYAKQFVRGGYSVVSWLVRDQIGEARRQLALATSEWRSATYQLPEYNRLLSQMYIDLYEGEPERAVATLNAQWSEVEKAQLLRIGIVRVQMWQLRAATAGGAAAAAQRRGATTAAARYRDEARRATTVLRRDPLARAVPMAALVDAALDVAASAGARAQERLEGAATECERHGMRLFAAAARFRQGQLRGGSAGNALMQQAREQFRKQNVVDPDRMVGMLAPGYPTS